MLDENDKQWINEQLDNVLKHVLAEISRRQEESNAQFGTLNSRLTLHAGLLQSGSRAVTRLIGYSENSEARRLDLEKRVLALENHLGPGPATAS